MPVEKVRGGGAAQGTPTGHLGKHSATAGGQPLPTTPRGNPLFPGGQIRFRAKVASGKQSVNRLGWMIRARNW